MVNPFVSKARKEIERKLLEMGVSDEEIVVEVADEYDPEGDRSEIYIADRALVSITSVYFPEILGMNKEDFQDFLEKVDAQETALVFDVEEDNNVWVSIIFEDGLEAFNIHRSTLIICHTHGDQVINIVGDHQGQHTQSYEHKYFKDYHVSCFLSETLSAKGIQQMLKTIP